MSALTANRLTPTRNSSSGPMPGKLALPVAANVHIYAGALVQTNSGGYAVPAGSAASNAGLITWGAALTEVDNTIPGNTNGGQTIEVQTGPADFFVGSAGDALTGANAGQSVYAIDDQTVGFTPGTPSWGTIVHVGTGPTLATLVTGTPVAVPLNSAGQALPLSVVVAIILGGAVGTATFQYSTNGGQTWSATTTTAATVAITDGLTLNFAAGTYVANDTYAQSYAGGRVSAGKLLLIDPVTSQAVVNVMPGIP